MNTRRGNCFRRLLKFLTRLTRYESLTKRRELFTSCVRVPRDDAACIIEEAVASGDDDVITATLLVSVYVCVLYFSKHPRLPAC